MTKIKYGFNDVEIQKIKRTYDYAIGTNDYTPFDVEKQRKDFITFVKQYDERRKTNFTETFPELKEMYDEYK